MKINIKKLHFLKRPLLLVCFFANMFLFASFTREDRERVREWKKSWYENKFHESRTDSSTSTNAADDLFSSLSNSISLPFSKEVGDQAFSASFKIPGVNNRNPFNKKGNYYSANEKEGTIGVFSDIDEDQITDNFFTVQLPKLPADSGIFLEYELYGLSTHHSVSRSVNRNISIGGEIIIPSPEWSYQREQLSRSVLREGLNTILFTSPSEGVKYKIRNLRLVAEPKQSREAKGQISSFLSGDMLYIKGLSNSSVSVNNSFVASEKGEFEKLLKLTEYQKKAGKFSVLSEGMTQFYDIPSEVKSFKVIDNKVYTSHQLDLSENGVLDFKYEGLHVSCEKIDAGSTASFNITKLREKDLPAVSGGLRNVTVNQAGYRFNRKAGKLSKKLKISIPYDDKKLGTTSPHEIRVYSFDYRMKQWKRESSAVVNQKTKTVSFEGDGDGDYINGVISVPEAPQTSSSNPTSISGLQAVNPTSARNFIKPPTANQKGSANISYPIVIPSGRNGVQPGLSVSYDSNKSNGWMGEGWDLNGLSAISLDVRWGSPKFDSDNETELYSLDGTMLVYDGSYLPHRHNDINEYSSVFTTDLQKRTDLFTGNVKKFFLRRNHDFTKIERYGATPKEYRWVVTDTNGGKTYYGGDENQINDNAVLKDSEGNVVHWAVWKTMDKFKNYVEYEYNKEIIQGQSGENVNLNKGVNFHVSKITYTKNDIDPGLKVYTVEFERENTILRKDISIFAKKGIKEVEPYRLKKIYVKYDGGIIRTYLLNYKEGEFSKTLLSNIRHIDDSHDQSYNNEQTEAYDFEYYNDLVDASGNQGANFGSDVNVNASIANAFPILPNSLTPSKIQANSTFEWGVNGRVGIGLSFLTPSQNPYGHVMASGMLGYSQAEAKNAQQLVDFNGDGIQDIIYRKPNDGLYVCAGSMASGTLTFGMPRKTVNLNSNFSYTKTKTDNKGWDWGVNIWGIGYNRSNVWSTTRSTSSTFLVDANSDGLIDVLKDGEVWFNHIDNNGANEMSPYSDTSENMVIVADDALQNNDNESGLDVVKFWIAPRSGYVKITDNISIENIPNAKAVYSVEMINPLINNQQTNGRVFLKVLTAGSTQSISISKYNDYFTQIQQTNPVQQNNHLAINSGNYLYVNSGDKIFVRLHKNYPKDFKVFSNPEVQYVHSLNSNVFNAKDYYQDDFRLNNGSYSSNYMLNNLLDNLSFDNPGTVTISVPAVNFPYTTDKIAFKIIKFDVNAGTETVIYPPAGGQQFYPQSNSSFTTSPVTLVENVIAGQPIKIKFKVESDTQKKFKDTNWNDIGVTYQTTIAGNSNPINVKGVAEYPSYYVTDMIPQIYFSNVLPYNPSIRDYHVNLKKNISGNLNGEFSYIIKRGNTVLAKRRVNVAGSYVTEYDVLNNQNLSYFAPVHFYTGDINPGVLLPDGQLSIQVYCNSEQEENFYRQFNTSSGNLPFYITMDNNSNSIANIRATSINSSSFNTFSAIYNNYGQFLYDQSSDLIQDKTSGGIIVNPNTPSDYFGLLINPLLINGLDMPNYNVFANCVNLPTQAEIQQCIDQNSGGYNSPNINSIPPAVFPLYPFKNSNGVEKWMGKGLPEQYSMADSFKDDDSVSSLFSTASIDPEIIDMPVQGNVDTKMWGISRRSYNKTKTLTKSGSLIVVNISNAESHVEGDKSVITDDFMDMNGDGYPDIVYRNSVQLTNSTGGLGGSRAPYLSNYISRSDNYQNSNAAGFSISGFKTAGRFLFGGESSSTTVADTSTPWGDPGASVTQFKDPSADVGLEYYMDINGDGLADRFNGNGSYILNMGYQMNPHGSESFNGLNSYASKPVGAAGLSLNFNLLSQGFSFDTGLSFGFGVNFGTSVAASMGTAERLYQDLNSDGLIDIVYVDGNNTKVSYNLGNKFAAPVLLYKGSSGNVDFRNEAKTYNAGASLNGHFYINFPICCLFVPLIYFKAGAQASGNLGISISEVDKSFKDMNGDGFPDLVVSNSSGFVVNHSKIGRTNKLKTVNGVDQKNLINTFTIDYEFTKPNYNDPSAKLVMKEIKVINPDIFSSQYLTTTPAKDIVTAFKYENSKYDRRERDNNGFEKVTTFEMDGTTVFRSHKTTYLNNSYFLNGLVLKSESFIGTSTPVSSTSNLYRLYKFKDNITKINIANPLPLSYDTGGTEGRKMATALLSSTENFTYEGTNFIHSTTNFEYNEKGQLEKYISSNPAAIYNSNIRYHDLPSSDNILNIPKSIRVYEGTSTGTLLRERKTEVDPSYGSITKVEVNLDGSQNAVTEMSYNQFGSLSQIWYPENDNGDKYLIKYEYDAETHKYVIKTKDIWNYESTNVYDHRFDVPTQTTDVSGNSTDFKYDAKGRVSMILAPKEKETGAPYTIMYEYYKRGQNYSGNLVNQPMYFGSVTTHYNAASPSEPLETISIADGFGKVVQTKKDIFYNGALRMSVSGRDVVDRFGRSVRQYHPMSEDKYPLTSPNNNRRISLNLLSNYYTEKVYDAKDRVLTDIDELLHPTDYTYSMENGLIKSTVTTMQNSINQIKSESFANAQGKTVITKNYLNNQALQTSFNYNTVGEILSVTDPEGIQTQYSYDLAGRRISEIHPDHGTTNYEYDPAGHMIKLYTENLQNAGGSQNYISYNYEINRLSGIKFPDINGNPNPSNVSYKYGDYQAGASAGKIVHKTDGSGETMWEYGNMGEVVSENRNVAGVNIPTANFFTKYNYDSWNRPQWIQYPDGELVRYEYDLGGNLKSIINGDGYEYVKDIEYDFYEQRTGITYGNDLRSIFTYTLANRKLENHNLLNASNVSLLNNSYNFDNVGNITGLQNISTPYQEMGGGYEFSYKYDQLNRLKSSSGNFNGSSAVYPVSNASFNNDLTYNNVGGIILKNQEHTQVGSAMPDNTYFNEYTYEQGTHKLISLFDMNTSETEDFDYDHNGNIVSSSKSNGDTTRFAWDEMDRMKAVNKYQGDVYQYNVFDDSDSRIIKYTLAEENQLYQNGVPIDPGSFNIKDFKMYPNPYVTLDSNFNLTKHYYAGSQRVASQIVKFDPSTSKHSKEESQKKDDIDREGDFKRYLEKTGGELKNISTQLNVLKIQPNIYYLHGDHLGTATFVTERHGDPTQFFLNLPFGETMAEQMTGVYDNPFKFNAKELDSDTGLYYYGARFYNPKLSIWYGVDPLTEKMPSWSPYVYTFSNPVRYTDPDGRFPVWTHYEITYATLLNAGVSYKTAGEIAHYASTYADHPNGKFMTINQAMAIKSGYNPNRLSYDSGKYGDYDKSYSQRDDLVIAVSIHAMRAYWEDITPEEAVKRSLEGGVYKEKNGKSVRILGANEIVEMFKGRDVEKLTRKEKKLLGVAFHTIQDAEMHKGGRWVDEHKKEAKKMGNESEHPDLYESSQSVRNLPEAVEAKKQSQRAAVKIVTGK